jgi:hypothetical protein
LFEEHFGLEVAAFGRLAIEAIFWVVACLG